MLAGWPRRSSVTRPWSVQRTRQPNRGMNMRRTMLLVTAVIGVLLMLTGTLSAYYDPVAGRFLSPDPLGHEASMDLYSYANGDPVNFMDPDGRFGKNAAASQGMSPQLSMNWDGSYSDVLKPYTDALKAQAAIDSGMDAEGAARQQYYMGLLRTAVSVVPMVPLLTSYFEAVNGRDMFTGERIGGGRALLNFGLSVAATLPMASMGVRPSPLQSSLMPRSVARMEMPTYAPKTVTNLRAVSSVGANAPFVARGWNPPYATGTRVRQFTAGTDIRFVRVHTSKNPEGRFLVREDAIAGMTPAQIQQYLALPELPTHVRPVSVRAGTRIQVGRVSAQPGFGVPNNGGFQYELLEDIGLEPFGKSTPLP
ncbi:MAG: RHS repeat-associated core domain-containing protein [Verrucomicrobia bacterium]|nr:RHS repeat-associated core domain-containing protein [Verrucomicrobiota bacterium]